MTEKELDKLIDEVTERYSACDADGVNKLFARLSDEDKAAFNARASTRLEEMQKTSMGQQATLDEMLRVSGHTRAEFDAEVREADRGKIGFGRER